MVLYSPEANTGKTKLLESFAEALGDYAAPVTAQLFASAAMEHNGFQRNAERTHWRGLSHRKAEAGL